MKISSRTLYLSFSLLVLLITENAALGQNRHVPTGGRVAVIVDERLAALRESPRLNGRLLRRMSRGRTVTIRGAVTSNDGTVFYRVKVTRRTRGWLQREAVASPSRAGDDRRLYRLMEASEDFDRIARARIFLDFFPRSSLRPSVLLAYATMADVVADKLTREAKRRLDAREMAAGGASDSSYFLNYVGLDRFNRQGIRFVFEPREKQLRYDGAAWRELARRYPRTAAAEQARKRLGIVSH